MVLRELWTKEVVDFHGRWHNINHAGLNPLPVQRPIPVWLGAGSPESPTPSDRILKRIARLADGWCPNFKPDAGGRATIDRVNAFAKEYGRDQASIGVDGRLRTSDGSPENWMDEAVAWKKLGARYLSIENRWGGLKTASEHIAAMQRFKATIGFDIWDGIPLDLHPSNPFWCAFEPIILRWKTISRRGERQLLN